MYFTSYGKEYSGIAPEGFPIPGGLFRPSMIPRRELMSRSALQPRPERIVLDPQLYLLDMPIDGTRHVRLIENLGSYSWFGVDEREFDSGEFALTPQFAEPPSPAQLWEKRSNVVGSWRPTVRGSIEAQLQVPFRIDDVLLPATLIQDPESRLIEEMERLDTAIQVARTRTEKPLYASLPLADVLFLSRDPGSNRLLDALVENLDAREDLEGVYIPLVQLNDPRERLCHERVVGSMLRLAKLFGQKSRLKAIFNFVEALGVACVALGAESYVSGYSTKHRRCSLSDFRSDKNGGIAYPKFFSLQTCMDFQVTDLKAMAERDLLQLLVLDQTESSKSLFMGLEAGDELETIAPWRPTANNVFAAKTHYFEQQVKALEVFKSADDVIGWLQDAESTWDRIRRELTSVPDFSFQPWTNGEHIKVWRRTLETIHAAP